MINGDVNFRIAEHHRLANHARCLTTAVNTFDKWLWKAGSPSKKILPSTIVNDYRHCKSNLLTISTQQMNRRKRRTIADGSKMTNHDWLKLLESCGQQHHDRFKQIRVATLDQNTCSIESDNDFREGCRKFPSLPQVLRLLSLGRSDSRSRVTLRFNYFTKQLCIIQGQNKFIERILKKCTESVERL